MTRPLSLLAATDFSDPARHALERAAQLAASHPGARLTLKALEISAIVGENYLVTCHDRRAKLLAID